MWDMKSILWEDKHTHSLEYFALTIDNNNAYLVILEGIVVLPLNSCLRVAYKMECDKHWRTKRVATSGKIRRDKASDSLGRWK
jgi:hypothetical protein